MKTSIKYLVREKVMMIDFRKTVTDIREIAKTPSFLDNDVVLADVYMVAKNELPAYALLPEIDSVELAAIHFDELVGICGKDFISSMSGKSEDIAFTILVYATYIWCVKISTDLRKLERSGKLKRVDPLVVPEGATIH
jgi:hypothetical protein